MSAQQPIQTNFADAHDQAPEQRAAQQSGDQPLGAPTPPEALRQDSAETAQPSGFAALSLRDEVLQAVQRAGYTEPTTVQAEIIPHMLAGRDLLAQSQTGTGKTAAFALPVLSRIELDRSGPQVLVLTPTRELAIQVAKSFKTYAAGLRDFKVATIYGGQDYEPQLRQLRQGAHVVVGTPGRVIDHIKRGTLAIKKIDCLVLDEADEMLNMGFLEDVQFVLQQAPDDLHVALFSATLPGPIQSIAEQYLTDPAVVKVKKKTATAESIRQRALFVAPRDKIEALTRLLEVEPTDGVIVFTKTKAATLTVAESLAQQGVSAVALNGDMPQTVRERTVEQFKAGRMDVLVATDVAARGLDVSRISHVINFDLPHDAESYIHRVGRTGRAGRHGEAIIFLTRNQRGKLRLIERATRQPIEVIELPTVAELNQVRVATFKQQITAVTAADDLTMFKALISEYAAETGKSLELIAAALAHLGQDGRPFLVKEVKSRGRDSGTRGQRSGEQKRDRRDDNDGRGPRTEKNRKHREVRRPEPGMDRYRVEIGRHDGVRPGNLVGAVANEAGIDGEFIGPIQIHDSYSTIDLPEGMPSEIYHTLSRTRVLGKQLRLSRHTGERGESRPERGPRQNAKQSVRPHRGRPQKATGKPKPSRQGKRRGAASRAN